MMVAIDCKPSRAPAQFFMVIPKAFTIMVEPLWLNIVVRIPS